MSNTHGWIITIIVSLAFGALIAFIKSKMGEGYKNTDFQHEILKDRQNTIRDQVRENKFIIKLHADYITNIDRMCLCQ